MATNLQERKIELIQWLSVIDDAALLQKIADLKDQDDQDWWDEISEAEKASVDRGLADADAGRLKSHAEARSIYEKRL
jgi:predicted transcriptional regulator